MWRLFSKRPPVNDEVKKQNQNLPGIGEVYNNINLHLYHYAGNNPIKYVDPDGRSSLDELRKIAKDIRSTGYAGEINIFIYPKNLCAEGCFARTTIISNYLRGKSYKVNYAYVNKPKMPEQEKRFNYHIAACVEIDGENYVVDPLYNLEGENSGLSKFNDWVSFQNPIEGNTPDKKNRIISGYDSKGNVKENYKLLYFYEKNNQNKQLSPFEYAAKLLEYFSKNNNLEYDGGEIK